MVLLLYSCTAVELSCCYSRPPPPARPVDRTVHRAVDHAPPPSPGRPSLGRRRRSLAVARSLARSPTVAHPPSLTHRRSPAVARSPSFACRCRRHSGGLWPSSSLARRRPLLRLLSPAGSPFVTIAARPGFSLHTPSPTSVPLNPSYIDTVSSPSKQAGSFQTVPCEKNARFLQRFISGSTHVELDPKNKLPPFDRHDGYPAYFPPLATVPHSGGCLCTSRKYWLCAIKGGTVHFIIPGAFLFPSF